MRSLSLRAIVLVLTLMGAMIFNDALAGTISCSLLQAQIYDGIPGPGALVGPSTGGCPSQATASSHPSSFGALPLEREPAPSCGAANPRQQAEADTQEHSRGRFRHDPDKLGSRRHIGGQIPEDDAGGEHQRQ